MSKRTNEETSSSPALADEILDSIRQIIADDEEDDLEEEEIAAPEPKSKKKAPAAAKGSEASAAPAKDAKASAAPTKNSEASAAPTKNSEASAAPAKEAKAAGDDAKNKAAQAAEHDVLELDDSFLVEFDDNEPRDLPSATEATMDEQMQAAQNLATSPEETEAEVEAEAESEPAPQPKQEAAKKTKTERKTPPSQKDDADKGASTSTKKAETSSADASESNNVAEEAHETDEVDAADDNQYPEAEEIFNEEMPEPPEPIEPEPPLVMREKGTGNARASNAASHKAPAVSANGHRSGGRKHHTPADNNAESEQASNGDGLIGDQTASMIASSFSALQRKPQSDQNPTVTDLVTQLLKPVLTQWLEDNLPAIVEREVQAEVRRLSDRANH